MAQRRPRGGIESRDVKATSVRFDDATDAAIRREAELTGASVSDFIRTAVVFRLAWIAALRAASQGADPKALADPDTLAEDLGRMAKRRIKRDKQ